MGFVFTARAQMPVIHSLSPLAAQVEQYDKFEVAVDLSATYANPYDYDQVRVYAVFDGPGGRSDTVDGFFMQDYALNAQTGGLSATGSSFRLRYAPDTTGTWSYTVYCTDTLGTGSAAAQTFSCVAPGSSLNRGYVRSDTSRYLRFDDDSTYVPVGENICWQAGNPYMSYRTWLDKLADREGNFFRLWHCHWGLGLEWLNNGYAGLRQYKQDNCAYQDWLFDYAAGKGIYVMVCLQHHGQVSTGVNPNWSESPYNTANGGMCAQTWDFFTHPDARAHVKNRLRYVVARWGYARSIMAWELFNEVDWTDAYDQHQGEVADWHAEMAAYLKAIDPYGHLVTTSFARDYNDPLVWALDEMDLTQTHYYNAAPNIERTLAYGIRSYADQYGKPTFNGEFGIAHASSELNTLDPNSIHIHNGIWGSLFAGGLGSAAPWFWDGYIYPRNLYTHFEALATLVRTLPLREAAYAPAPVQVRGTNADLVLTPSLNWGAYADTSFSIDAYGTVTPAGGALSEYLYGAQWNTVYRRPPVFDVDYPASGTFAVRTGSSSGQAPRITIWLDDNIVLDQAGQTNQTYSIAVSAGPHRIRVDNTGTDWITIAAYTFSGIGSAVDAYVLRAAGGESLAGWLLNNRYNHDHVRNNGTPPAASGASLRIAGVAPGSYYVKWYHCLTGALTGAAPVATVGDTLMLATPTFTWDLAFVVDNQATGIAAQVRDLPVQCYPNPWHSGPLTVRFAAGTGGTYRLGLLDMGGRDLGLLHEATLGGGEQTLHIGLPEGLPTGLYWLRLDGEGQRGAAPLLVR
ncbi:MAG: hypothetical protein OHK0039_06590 [Bacteroidia bacterium]